MSELYDVIGNSENDQLLADPNGSEVIGISCYPSGVVKRGTVMYKGADGFYRPAAAADITADKAFAVLNETVDTGSAPAEGEEATAEDAAAYRTGRFINKRVTLASDAVLTEAHKVILGQQGIFFKTKDGADETFTNTI